MSSLAVTLTVEELDALVRKAVRIELAKRPAVPVEDKIMTRAEVAKVLRVDPKVVTAWVRKRGLPGRKVVGQWRFSKNDVLRWQEEK